MTFVRYSVLRLGLFGVCLWLLLAAGTRSWLAVLVAAFGAWALSYVLLGRQRDAAARWVADRVAARASRSGKSLRELEDSAAEDAEADGVAGEGQDDNRPAPAP